MNFYPVYLRGRPHEIAYYRYGPIGQTTGQQHNSADAHVQRITLGSGKRAIAGNIARMISAFEVNPDHRRRLGHDCAVFVLACQTGDDYSATAFGKSRNSPRIAPALLESIRRNDVEQQPVGTIIRTSAAAPGTHHFSILASVDSDDATPALFAWKAGVDGAVAIGTFKQLALQYPVPILHTVGRMTISQIG
jgi:hypothetical protein